MYMYSFSVCRFLVLSRRSWNVLCWGNHLSAGFADMLRQSLFNLPNLFILAAVCRKSVSFEYFAAEIRRDFQSVNLFNVAL